MDTSAIKDTPFEALRDLDGETEVLSVYLSLALGRSVEQGHRAELINTLRSVRESITDADALRRFEVEAARVTEFLENDFEPQGRAIAIFSSEPRGLLVDVPLQLELTSQARFGRQPYLRPIEQEPGLDRICVALIDRQQARVLTARLGFPETDKHVRDYLPRKTHEEGRKHQRTGNMGDSRQGGDASTNEEGSIEAWVDKHFQDTYDMLLQIDEDTPFARLVIGGVAETLPRFIEGMPDALQRQMTSTITIEAGRSGDDIIEMAMESVRVAAETEALDLVQRTLDAANAGGQGVTGWDGVFRAFIEGRVQEFVVSEDKDTEGHRCPEGHYVAVNGVPCPACGAHPEVVPSLLDAAEAMARATSAAVRIVRGEASERLNQAGGVAVLLRY